MTNNAAQINVTVATLWTDPSSPREIDRESLGHPAQITKWLDQMSAKEKKDLLDQNKVQSQLLYGDVIYIIEETDQWARVIVPHQASQKDERGYPGWVPLNQLTKIDAEDAEGLLNQPIITVTEKITSLYNYSDQKIIPLSYNTVLPLLEESDTYYEVSSPHGGGRVLKTAARLFKSIEDIPTQSGQTICKEAARFQDLEYLWGGMSAYGYDCSGFTYSILKANGYLIPRDASDQSKKGEPIKKEDVLPGDLLFFAYEEGKGRLHHVGIYYGDGQMIHSPTPGKKIMIQKIAGTFYEKEWCETRRYWRNE